MDAKTPFTSTPGRSKWEDFFGPPPRDIPQNAYDSISYTHYDLPAFYKGDNLYLRDVVVNGIVKSEEFFTTVLCPWARTDKLRIVWNEWIFDTTVADQVPYEAASRLMTSQRKAHARTIRRRGLAFMLEGDFADTEDGIKSYLYQIRALITSVQETQNYDTVYEMLTCKSMERFRFDKYSGVLPMSFTQVMEDEILDWGSMNDDMDRVDLIYQKNREVIQKGTRQNPDFMLVDGGSKTFFTMASPDRNNYSIKGPEGPATFNKGPSAMDVWRDGITVYETREFNVSDVKRQAYVQLLQREANIGEVYFMTTEDFEGRDLSDYSSIWRTIVLYNENADRWEKIPLLDALKNCHLFSGNGWDSAVINLLDEYKSGKRRGTPYTKPKAPGSDDDDDDDFFLFTKNRNKEYMMPKYFGQMPEKSVKMEHFIQMAQSLLGTKFTERDERYYVDCIDLIEEIESQPYVHEWFKAVIELNKPNSVNEKDVFIGEVTPNDVATYWNVHPIREWAPNAYGSLILPQKTQNMIGLEFPVGFNNWAGLKCLAAEADKKNSSWKDLGIRAACHVKLFKMLAEKIASVAPGSEAVNPMNLPPEFHNRDIAGALFQQFVAIRRPPIFLPHLPSPVNLGGNVIGTTKGGATDSEQVKYIVFPLLFTDPAKWDTATTDVITYASIKDAIENPSKGSSTFFDPSTQKYDSSKPPSIVYTIDGTVYTLPYGLLKYSELVPNVFYLMCHLGVESLRSLKYLYSEMQKKAKLGDTLVDTMVSWLGKKDGNQNVRRFLIGLRAYWDVKSSETGFDVNRDVVEKFKSKTFFKETYTKGLIVQDPEIANMDKVLTLLKPGSAQPFGANVNKPGDIIEVSKALSDLQAKIGEYNKYMQSIGGEGLQVYHFYDLKTKLTLTAQNTSDAKEAALIKSINDMHEALANKVAARYGSNVNIPQEYVKEKMRQNESLSVADDPAAIASAAWYRSPLSMSFTLLESSGKNLVPLIRPGDPRKSYTLPLPGGTGGLLPDEYWKNREWASIDTKDRDESVPFSNLHFVSVLSSPSPPSSFDEPLESIPNTSLKTKKKPFKVNIFEDSDEEISGDGNQFIGDEMELDEDKAFPGPTVTPGSKDPGKWTKKDLKGAGRDYIKRVPFKGTATYDEVYTDTFINRYVEANKISNNILRTAVFGILTTPFTPQQWIRFVEKDVFVPIGFILWRLMISHMMSNFVLGKSGPEMGANFIGHTNFSVGYEASVKVILGNFTFHSKAVILEPKLITLMENMRYVQYLGGNNTAFITSAKDVTAQGRNRKSIIVTAIPITENKWNNKMFSFIGKPPVIGYSDPVSQKQESTYSTASFYNSVYKLSNMANSWMNIMKGTFFDAVDYVNVVGFQGHQIKYNPITRMFDQHITCKGHRKEKGTGPGSAAVTNGRDKTFQKRDWSTVRIA